MNAARILIVEDSASLAMSYAAQLSEAGHEVELAQTGAGAETQLTGARFDVTSYRWNCGAAPGGSCDIARPGQPAGA
ncbi:response regulator [Erythrobacteraceae bacterium WH01K]|nr:response regulator [Erythrobacteraceae bacterium WH01K]